MTVGANGGRDVRLVEGYEYERSRFLPVVSMSTPAIASVSNKVSPAGRGCVERRCKK
jgi:hypothetical protein